MAMIQGQDPTTDTGGDWWDQNAPTSGTSTSGAPPTFDQVNQDYLTWLGRPLSQAEYDQNWAHATNYNASMVSNSAEGLARTNQNVPGTGSYDPSVTIAPGNETGQGGAPRPTQTGDTTTPGTTTTPSTNPITTQPIGVPTSGFGAAPTPYASDPNAPQYQPLPAYTAPTWTGGDYVPPTEQDLLNSPGYQSRLDTLLTAGSRRYAAQGSILNGGTVKALDRTAQDYASNEYQNLNANAYDQYKTRYAQFTDAAGRDLASRSINAADASTTYANRTAAYSANNARTLNDYITNVNTNRNSELDYWSRLMDVNRTGADLAGASR